MRLISDLWRSCRLGMYVCVCVCVCVFVCICVYIYIYIYIYTRARVRVCLYTKMTDPGRLILSRVHRSLFHPPSWFLLSQQRRRICYQFCREL
jgi:hypothetical protein